MEEEERWWRGGGGRCLEPLMMRMLKETALKEHFNLREIGGLSDDDGENEEKESLMEENRW